MKGSDVLTSDEAYRLRCEIAYDLHASLRKEEDRSDYLFQRQCSLLLHRRSRQIQERAEFCSSGHISTKQFALSMKIVREEVWKNIRGYLDLGLPEELAPTMHSGSYICCKLEGKL